jgi:hypothetical protein
VRSETTSATATLDDLKAILEVGEILALALSEGKTEQFSGRRWVPPIPAERLSRRSDGSLLSQYVSTSILDADREETDHKEDDL